MDYILLHAHSGLRYLVLLAGLVAVVYAATGLLRGRAYDRGMRITSLAYAGFLHLQVLVGLFLLVSGRFQPTALIMHIFLALMAAVVAQLPPSVMRRRPPEERTYAPHLVGTVASLALIVLAILSLGRSVL